MRQRMVAMGLFILVCGMTGCASHDATHSELAEPAGTTAAIPESDPSKQPDLVEADPAWFACQQNMDCQVVEGMCGEPQAINIHFLTDYSGYRNRMNQMVECAVKGKGTRQATQKPPKCLENRCVLEPKAP